MKPDRERSKRSLFCFLIISKNYFLLAARRSLLFLVGHSELFYSGGGFEIKLFHFFQITYAKRVQ